MLRSISSFLHHQADAARDFVADTFDRGTDLATSAGRTAMGYTRQFASSPSDTMDMLERRLRRYGLTPEMIASLTGPQLRRMQRLAMRQMPTRAPSILGTVLAIGVVAAAVYALTRDEEQDEEPASQNAGRSRG
jgi:hypothetical protein